MIKIKCPHTDCSRCQWEDEDRVKLREHPWKDSAYRTWEARFSWLFASNIMLGAVAAYQLAGFIGCLLLYIASIFFVFGMHVYVGYTMRKHYRKLSK